MRALLLGLLAGFLSWGCHSPASQPKGNLQHISLNLVSEPQTLDPRQVRDTNGQAVVRLLFEGLTRVNPNEKAELALADSLEISPDLKTYVFSLRKSLWSNGDPVTAEDFVHAWKCVLDPAFPSDTAFQLYGIRNAKAIKEGTLDRDALGVHALGEHTLLVELEYPIPYFLELVALPCFFPVHAGLDQSNPKWASQPATFVGNGPFCMSAWKHQDQLELQKNSYYWDAGSVALGQVTFVMVPEVTELKMFEAGELAMAGSPLSALPVDALQTLKSSHALKTKELLGTYFIRVNVAAAPFNHPEMRRAFAYAIHRKQIVEHVTQGNQFPATGLVPLSLGLQTQPYFLDGDVDAAQARFAQALSELHLQVAELPVVKLLYNATERNHLIAQAIQQQWYETLGVRVELEAVESKIYFDRLAKQDYQLASGNWIADFGDAINFLEVFKHKTASSNNTRWENSRFRELLELSFVTSDCQKRQNLLKESEAILMQEMPVIPIFYYTMLYMQQPELQGVLVTPMGQLDLKWAHLLQERNLIAEGKL